MTRTATRDGRDSAFAGATVSDAQMLNPYLNQKKAAWGAEMFADEWAEAFLRPRRLLEARMNEDQMRALMAWIDARIDEKIEDAFSRDSFEEAMHRKDCAEELARVVDPNRRRG